MVIDLSTLADRWWIPKGSNLALEGGFFDPNAENATPREQQVTYLHCLDADVPCIVLLGPPGIGKSTEFLRASRAAHERGYNVHLLELRATSSSEALGNALFNVELPGNVDGPRIVFLDSLDEATVTVPVMQQWLLGVAEKARQLTEESGQKILLRISSRTADWSEQFEEQLRQVWGKDAVEVFELPPLTRPQVATFVDSRTTRRDEFFAALQQSDTGAFASRPVTLNMLIDTFVAQGALPDNKVTIYRRGLLALLEESNRARRAGGATGDLSPEQRFVIAARLAAACVLSTKRAIWDGLYSDPMPEDAIPVAELTGGMEEALGHRVHVSAKHIREILRTGVFRPLSEDTFEWAHNTFAEFLGAYYINAHTASAEKILSLVRFGMPGNDRVVPQLREVAAWLSTLEHRVLEELIVSEPELLLGSDVALASPGDRREVVARLLSKLDSGEIYDKSDWRPYYRRLDHPDLPKQLAPIIRDGSKNTVLRRAAIDIAEACSRGELVSDLQAVAFDETDNPHIRAQATHALTVILPAEQRQQLVPLALQSEPDPDDEIKGYALLGLWPHNLSARQLFRALTKPKETSLIGSYALFLYHLRIENLERDGALAALEWLMGQSSYEHGERSFAAIIPTILTNVWRNADDPEVVRGLAVLVLSDRFGSSWFRHETDLKSFEDEYHASPPERRRKLLLAVFAQAPNEWKQARFLTFAPWRVVTLADLPWLVPELLGKSGPWRDEWLIDIIVSLITWDSRAQIEFLWDVPHPGLKHALDSISFVPLDSDIAKWHREERERLNRAAEQRTARVSREQRIEQLLKRTEGRDPDAFWLLNLALLEDDAQRIDEFTGVLAPSPGWARLDSSERRRVVAAAHRYLDTYRLEADYLEPNVHHRPAAAGYRALRLLVDQDQEAYEALTEEVWSRWALPIVALTSNDSKAEREIQKRILKDCFSRAPDAVLAAVSAYLRKAQSFYLIIDLVTGWAPASLFDVIWTAVNAFTVSDDEYERALKALLESDYQPAIERATGSLSALLRAGAQSVSERELNAAAAIVSAQPQRGWGVFRQIIVANQDVGRALLTRVASNWRNGGAGMSGLTEAQQAQLYAWIETLVPRPPEQKGAHFVTPIEEVFHFQRTLLGNLVNRGTSASVAAVAFLVDQFPQFEWLRWSLEEARENQRRVEWTPLAPRGAIEQIIGRRLEFSSVSDKTTIAQEAFESAALRNPEQRINLEADVPRDVALPAPKPSSIPTDERKLTFLVVNDEWSSGHGGISTFSRHLCIALAQYGHEVYCFMPAATERDVSQAKQEGVSIVVAGPHPGLSPGELLARGPLGAAQLKPDAIIGHDQVTGAQAHALAREVFKVPYLHFIHSSPEEVEVFKDTEQRRDKGIVDYVKSGKKAGAQYDLCLHADMVLAVGPKLERGIRTSLIDRIDPQRIIQVLPGFNPELLRFLKPASSDFDLRCLFSGRLDETQIKGADLLVRIAGQFQARSLGSALKGTVFIMRGFEIDTMNEKVAALCTQHNVKLDNIRARHFITDEVQLLQELKGASIYLMPSKIEGFGLTGLDAIAAGVPLMASADSGLALALINAAPDLPGNLKQIAVDCVLDVQPDGDGIVDAWVRGLTTRLLDRAKAFSDASDLRNALKATFDWTRAAETVTRAAAQARE